MAKKIQLLLKAKILQMFGAKTATSLEKSKFVRFPNATKERVEELRNAIECCFIESVRWKDHKVLAWMTSTKLLQHLSVDTSLKICSQLLSIGEKSREDAKNAKITEENYSQIASGIYRLLREKPAATTRKIPVEVLQKLKAANPRKKGLDSEKQNLFTLTGIFNDSKILQHLLRSSTMSENPAPVQAMLNSYKDEKGRTLAHLAAMNNSKDVLDWLQDSAKGALMHPAKDGKTALDMLNEKAREGCQFAQGFLFKLAQEKCAEGAKISKTGISAQKAKTPPKKQTKSNKEPTMSNPD